MRKNQEFQWKEMTMGVAYYPEHWDKTLWRDDLQRMLNTGITTIRIAEFAWNLVEPREGEFTFDFWDEYLDLCEEMGMHVIFCTPSATPPAWLTEKYPEVLNANLEGVLYRHGGRRHYNYNSKIYQMFVSRIVEKEAEHYAKHPAIVGWQIDNEINCEISNFYSEADSLAFRIWAKEKYQTLDALNKAWGTVFWNQTYTDWNEIHVPRMTNYQGSNPHMHLDYYRFISDSARKFCLMQAEIIRKYRKEGDFITTNGKFWNLDNHAMKDESLDVYTYDCYPNFAQALETGRHANLNDRHWSKHLIEVRSINPHFGIMEQQSGAGGWATRMHQPNPRPGQLKLWAMQCVAQGADYISFFRWRTCTFGTEIYWYGILDHDNRDNRKIKEVKDFYDDFKKLDPVCGAENVASFALLKDYDNEWDTNTDTWHADVTGASEEEIFIASELNHTPYDMLYLREDITVEELSKYPVIFYAHPSLIDEKRTELLSAYVEQGGTLILGCRSGHKDMNGKCVMMPQPGLLQKLTGTDIHESTYPSPFEEPVYAVFGEEKMETPVFNDLLTPIGDAKVLAAYANSYFKGTAALVENRYGKGRVLHLGSTFSRNNVKQILEYLNILEPFADLIEASENVQLIMREKDGRKYLFALNYQPAEEAIVLKKTMHSVFKGLDEEGTIVLNPYETAVYAL